MTSKSQDSVSAVFKDLFLGLKHFDQVIRKTKWIKDVHINPGNFKNNFKVAGSY
ncbi:hypothetical protein [Salegentibacter sp. 24]|uniref:hypothetical protein n=1 Tax=Salegentibacter sp. 24 TaxID=2183986 RepID=UPI0014152E83|nr:hypothetical protein [Salegentibacter sp. 24]